MTQTVPAQRRDHRLFVTAACFNPDPPHPSLAQPGRQRRVPIRTVVDLQLLWTLVESHVELVLAGVDAGTNHAMLGHLRRPFLVMRTLGSFNHPGPDEEPIAILLTTSPCGSGALDPTTGDPLRAATRSGSFLAERTNNNRTS